MESEPQEVSSPFWEEPSRSAPAAMPDAPAEGLPLSIHSLPPEVLAQVLNNLSHLDVVSAAGVCSQWLDVANSLVLAPRGHLVLHGQDGRGPGRYRNMTTLHVVNATDIPATLVRATEALVSVRAMWLHEQCDARPAIPRLRTEESLRATLDAIFTACPNVASINFANVPQSAMLLRLLVDRGPKPRFRTRCVFVERDHNAQGALDTLTELGAFFQEAVVATLRPALSITARYPHYWSPAARLALPYHRDVRALSLQAAGLQSPALSDIARIAHLRTLHLHDAEGLDDEALTVIVKSVRRLARLSVHDAPAVTSTCWATAFQSPCLEELESLQLSACQQLDDVSLSWSRPLHRLSVAELDLESCTKVSATGLQHLFAGTPNVKALTLAVPFSPSITEGLALAPDRLLHLKRLRFHVQGSTWQGDAKVAIAGVEALKKKLRKACPINVQMDVSITFVKLGLAVSNSPDEENDVDVDVGL